MKAKNSLMGMLCLINNLLKIKHILALVLVLFYIGAQESAAQTPKPKRTITGTVVSAKDGKPVEGASVRNPGYQQGSLTDKNGNFSISTSIIKTGELYITLEGYDDNYFPYTISSSNLKISLHPISDPFRGRYPKFEALKIGEKVPDIEFAIKNYHSPTAKISDFKGKLLILDFWATWCSPCVAMIPKMDELQKEFGDKIQFLSVTYEKEEIVLPFLEKFHKQKGQKYNIPNVMNDDILRKFFPHKVLPHYVWIDAEGTVKAVTEFRQINKGNITLFLKNNHLVLPEKKDDPIINQNRNLPMFLDGTHGNLSFSLIHSILLPYVNGLSSAYTFGIIDTTKTMKITAVNLSIPNLYQLAYGEGIHWYGSKNTLLEVKDSSKFLSNAKGQSAKQWLEDGNGYCFELMLPDYQKDMAFKLMQANLNAYFSNYTAAIKDRNTRCLVLTRTSLIDKIKSKGGKTEVIFDRFGCEIKNNYLIHLTSRLDVLFLQNEPYPIVDGTGYEMPVDLKLIGNMSSLTEINKALEAYDLQFIEKDFPIKMLIIKDKL